MTTTRKAKKKTSMPKTLFVGTHNNELLAEQSSERLVTYAMEDNETPDQYFDAVGEYQLVSTGRIETSFVKNGKK